MIVVVTGGRDYAGKATLHAALDRLHATEPIRKLLHGACGMDKRKGDLWNMKGADRWADEWARRVIGDENTHAMPADWSAYGGAAGPIRNADMLALAVNMGVARDEKVICIACPGGRGTTDCTRKARAASIRVRPVDEVLADPNPVDTATPS